MALNSDLKSGFWIGLGVAIAFAVLGLVQMLLGKVSGEAAKGL